MQVTLLYFAALRDCRGSSEERMTLPEEVANVEELISYLDTQPSLNGKLKSVRVAVNESFAEPNVVLHEGDVVALIPPVQGG